MACQNGGARRFARPTDGTEKAVAWGSGTLVFPGAHQLRVVNYVGGTRVISDGGPGDADNKVNGSVSLGITIDPVYIQVLS